MSLYGLPPAELGPTRDHLLAVEAAFTRPGQPSLMCDNLVTLSRIHSFAHDQAFVAALAAAARSEADYHNVWKIHTYCWAARSALALEGDFVECGVFEGLYSAAMTRYLDWGNAPKTLYLYDTFAGLDPAYSSPSERDINQYYALRPEWHGEVVARFAGYANVRVVKGVVPTALDSAPARIAFLHLDMNAAAAETAALDRLFPRIVPGGFVLMDDYGRFEQRELHAALKAWMTEAGYSVLELPTGQGMVVKR